MKPQNLAILVVALVAFGLMNVTPANATDTDVSCEEGKWKYGDVNQDCAYTCTQGRGTNVAVSSQEGDATVSGEAECGRAGQDRLGPWAHCERTGSCSDSSPDVSSEPLPGSCSGYISSGAGDLSAVEATKLNFCWSS